MENLGEDTIISVQPRDIGLNTPRETRKMERTTSVINSKLRSTFPLILKMSFLYDLSNQLLGRPYYLNKTTWQLEPHTTFTAWRKYHWGASLSISIATTLAQVILLGIDINDDTFEMNNVSNFCRCLSLILCLLGTGLLLNDAIFLDDVTEFVNKVFTYLNLLAIDGIFEKPKKFDRLVAMVLAGLMGALGSMVGVVSILMYFRCTANPFSGVLPICLAQANTEHTISDEHDRDYGKYENVGKYESEINILMGVALMIGIASHCMASGYLFIGTYMAPIMGCQKALMALSEPTGVLVNKDRWRLHFTCLQLLFSRVNVAVRHGLVSLGLLVMCAWIVFLNYALIKLDLGFLITAMVLVMYGYLGIISYLVLRQGAFLPEISETTLDLAKKQAKLSRDKGFYIWLRSRKPLTISIGSFSEMTKETCIKFWEVTIDYTIDILLTY